MDKSSETRTVGKKGSWQPAASDRICSIHFADGLATDKISHQPFFLVMKLKRKNEEEHYLKKHWKKSEGR